MPNKKEIAEEQKEVDAEFFKEGELFTTIFKKGPLPLVVIDSSNRFVKVNSAFCNLIGYSEKEIIGKTTIDFTYPEDKEKTVKLARKIFTGEMPTFQIEKRYVKKNGKVLWIEVRTTVMVKDKKLPLYGLGLVQDITNRKVAEQNLRLQSGISKNLSEGILLVRTKDSAIVYTNPKFDEMFGYSANELIGKHVSVLNAPTDTQSPLQVAKKIIHALKTKGSWHGELQNIRKDGALFWCEASISKFHHEEYGEVWISVHSDITKRKKDEERLRLFSAAVEYAPDGFQLVDLDGRIMYSNFVTEKMYGFSRKEFLGKHVSELNVDPPFAHKVIIPNVKRLGHWAGEIMVKKKNGNVFPVMLTAAMVKDEKGTPVAMVGVIKDITEAKQTEKNLKKYTNELENTRKALLNVVEDLNVEKEKLQEAEAKDEALLTSIGDGLVAVDRKGNIIKINEQAIALLGLEKKKVMDKPYHMVWKIVDGKNNEIPTLERPTMRALELKKRIIVTAVDDVWYVRDDGTKFPIDTTVAPVILNNQIVGAVSVFRDISKEKNMERLRMDFLSLASHQLRTPLSGTKWLIETMLEEIFGKLNDKQKEYLNELYKINERMIHLVSDMLDVLRLESGGVLLKKKNVSIAELALNLSSGMEMAAKNKNIVFRKTLKDHKEFLIETDFEILQTILETLFSNAINYSMPNQEVFFDITINPHSVLFSVEDHGLGIPKDEQKSIFQRFYRASNAKAFKPDGSGLGLYIAAMLAEKIGAKITFTSEIGKGTTFYLKIPRKVIVES